MKKMRLHKLLAMVCCLTIGICGMNINSISVEATQSKSENFNSVTLTGNYADDMVAIAKAQEGRTQSQMGYTESWCADFVSDCAKIAGISNLIPFNGLVSSLYNAVISAGGTVVTTPQKGDLVFYYCTKCASPYKHAGIMVDATSSIDGNYGSKVTQHLVSYYNDGSHYVSKGEVQCIYVRPAYNASPTPPITDEYRTGQYKVTAEPSLRVRNQPSTSGTQLGSVMKGALVQVLEVKNGWGKIKFNGNDGWISLEFCEYIGSGDQSGSDPGDSNPGNQSVDVLYETHIENIGWQGYVKNGQLSGTSGQAKRLEGIKIKLNKNSNIDGGIEYSTHVQDIGWQNFVSEDNISGTTGQCKRLEGIKIRLTGGMADQYNIYYRVHCQDIGWLDWAKNGEAAGTEGYGRRLEAIEIQLINKSTQSAPGSTTAPFIDSNNPPVISCSTHVEDIGWQGYVTDGQLSGTTGQAKRLEGIKIKLGNSKISGGISYSTHIQDIGWQGFVSDDSMSGTTGQCKRLEAIKIQLTGTITEFYDVYYRVHAQDYGWLGWAKNGEESGTQGLAKRLEAIEIQLVKKGYPAPGSTYNPYVNGNS